jgi:hypothetical protein
MSRKKLLLVVGAGASLDFGLPSVAGVHDIINTAMQRLYQLQDQPDTNLYAWIRDIIDDHWQKSVPNHLRRPCHFEDVLYTIFALSATYPAGADSSSLGALIKLVSMPDVSFMGCQRRSVGLDLLQELGSAAVDVLVAEVRKRCIDSATACATQFAQLQSLLTALQGAFEIAIVTVNYDNILRRALSGLETGFDDKGKFDELRIFDRKGWSCLLHLHGSVHFDRLVSANNWHEIYWQDDLSADFKANAGGGSGQTSPEGATFPTSIIVAGYGKTTQILRRPFRVYYSELDRLVASCDAALFAGYGFGDVHLNKAFDNFRDDRNRPVTIIGFARPDAMNMCSASIGDYNPYIDTLINTFRTDPKSMTALGSSTPDTVDDLLEASEFETSNDPSTPLALWYGGLMAACGHSRKVIDCLRP